MKKNYTQPTAEVIELAVEQGFNVSGGATIQTLREDDDMGNLFN